MLPGAGSTVGKAVYAVVGIALIGFAVWRISSATKGGGGSVEYAVLCAECKHEAKMNLKPGGGELPRTCPKCGKKALWIGTPCPFCGKTIALIDRKQPAKCPHCAKQTPDL